MGFSCFLLPQTFSGLFDGRCLCIFTFHRIPPKGFSYCPPFLLLAPCPPRKSCWFWWPCLGSLFLCLHLLWSPVGAFLRYNLDSSLGSGRFSSWHGVARREARREPVPAPEHRRSTRQRSSRGRSGRSCSIPRFGLDHLQPQRKKQITEEMEEGEAAKPLEHPASARVV